MDTGLSAPHAASYIQTVTGPVTPSSLGIVLAHEHVFIDYRCVYSAQPEADGDLGDVRVSTDNSVDVRSNPHHVRDNLLLNDEDVAVNELTHFSSLGGGALVDLTTVGLAPDPVRLRNVSVRTGLKLIAGCGYYRHIAQTPGALAKTSEVMTAEIMTCLLDGIAGSSVRAGIIGEIGTTCPLHPFEAASLIAAAHAQRLSGAAINVHPDVWERGHFDVLDVLERAGADLSKTIVSHVDEIVDPDFHARIAERGVYLSFDTFGSEFTFDGTEEPRDTDRITCIQRLLDKGYAAKILLSQDVCYKIQLTAFGGRGYGHILENVVPSLRAAGVGSVEIMQMLVDNPARVLAIETSG